MIDCRRIPSHGQSREFLGADAGTVEEIRGGDVKEGSVTESILLLLEVIVVLLHANGTSIRTAVWGLDAAAAAAAAVADDDDDDDDDGVVGSIAWLVNTDCWEKKP